MRKTEKAKLARMLNRLAIAAESDGCLTSIVDRLPGQDGAVSRYLALVATTDLSPGRYRVEVRATGGPSALPSTREVSFRVRE
jgi:hypothetical protein